ncbi:MAG: SH3 domain-containing protein [Chloroflexi bacterium]|nr:SH3 domain-containing protein [Chloroflexota bacterium]
MKRFLPVFALAILAALLVLPSAASAGEDANSPIAAAALSRVGTYGGQCWTFMQEVVQEATGRRVGNDYRQGFFDAGAIEVSAEEARNGDIIQTASDADTSPWASYSGLHTGIVLKNLGGGRFDIVDSNQNWDEMVNLRPNYDPYANAARYGLQVHIYRIPGNGSGAVDAGAGSPSVDAGASATWSIGEQAVVATDFGCLNMRTGAKLGASVVKCLANGTTGTIVDGPVSADGYSWVKIETAQGTGWVATRYLTKAPTAHAAAADLPSAPEASPAPENAPVPTDSAPAPVADVPEKTARTDNSPGCLRVRDSAGLGGAVLACLSAGTAVTVLDGGGVSADGYTWTRVRLESGAEGWVASRYLVSS